MISAIIMASGFSRRMGQDKLKLEINDLKMFQITVNLISNMNFEKKFIITNDFEIAEYAEMHKIKAIKNPLASHGKSGSIKTGVLNSKDCAAYMFFVCDQPLLTKSTVERIIQAYKMAPEFITVPYYKDSPGSPVIFPAKYKAELLNLNSDSGGREIIKRNVITKVHIENADEIIDIDNMEDYGRIQNAKK